ncbi:MAG: TIGR04282 family arsenosugar biosynthesis glycosyltransferase [Nitrospirae bacterium]|nr:TIGR04282 family arsenosugar biosynthesis glycosyltransferase [Nitrospirota bacterium]
MNDSGTKPALVIFTKEPKPGLVKTRFMPTLTADECAGLQEGFIADVLDKFAGRDDIAVSICFTPDNSRYFELFGLPAFPQGDGDIGGRMFRALHRVMSFGAEKAVLIGTDMPHIDSGAIDDALAALDSADVVFGPADDGGYYLVGIKKPACSAIFTGVEWSTPHVLAQSEDAARAAGLATARIQPGFDIDTPEDLARLMASGKVPAHTAEAVSGFASRLR